MQDFVRRNIIEWLQHLRGMGFGGERWDFVCCIITGKPSPLACEI